MTDTDAVEPSYLYATKAFLDEIDHSVLRDECGMDIVSVRETKENDHHCAGDIRHVSFRHPDVEPGMYYVATLHRFRGGTNVTFSPAEYTK